MKKIVFIIGAGASKAIAPEEIPAMNDFFHIVGNFAKQDMDIKTTLDSLEKYGLLKDKEVNLEHILERTTKLPRNHSNPWERPYDGLLLTLHKNFYMLNEILKQIQSELLAHIKMESIRETKQDDLLVKIENLFKQQTHAAQQISEKLETLDPVALETIAKYVASLERRNSTAQEVDSYIEKSKELLGEFRRHIRNDIRKEISSFESLFADFQERLGKAQTFISSSSEKPDPLSLGTIMQLIKSDTSHKTLLEIAEPFKNATALMDALETETHSEMALTVDFTEIYRYSFALFDVDPRSTFDAYLFRSSKTPLFLLPGSLIELNNFLTRRFTEFLDYRSFRDSFLRKLKTYTLKHAKYSDFCALSNILTSDEKFILFGTIERASSPYSRLRSLLEGNIVIPMSASELPKLGLVEQFDADLP